jgi:TonB family protein
VKVIVRQLTCIALLLFLAACRSGPSTHTTTAQELKKPSNQSTTHVGDFLATPENCGMIGYVRPVYPKEAKRARIEGVVKFNALITKTGEVDDLGVISGNPALVPAAMKAVKQWRYAPCRLNGEPVEVKTQVDVSFTLSH